MSLKSKASAWGMLTWVSSFIAVVLRGPTILADSFRSGRRAGLPALTGLILGGALARLLPAVASRPNDVLKHTQVLPDIPARLDEHYGWITSRRGEMRPAPMRTRTSRRVAQLGWTG